MADRTVTVRVSAVDQYSQTLDRYSQKIKTAADDTKRVGQASGEASSGISSMAQAAQGALVAFGALGVLHVAQELNEIGMQSIATEATFNQLSGGALEVERTMQLMRDASGGVITDLQLMGAANVMLQTGIGQTAEEMAEFVRISTVMGRSVGQDAATALENARSAVLNMSYVRLDTLGISAANVRQRVDELTRSGMEAQQAFTQAFLEEGRQGVLRLGDAADISSTAFARLQTRWDNFANTTANRVAQGVEGIALAFEHADQIIARTNDSPLYGIFGVPLQLLGIAADQSAEERQRALEQAIAAAQNQAHMDNIVGALNGGITPGGAMRVQERGMLGNASDADMAELYNSITHAGNLQGFRQFFTEDEAQNARYIRGDAERLVALLEQAHDIDLISDDTLQRAHGFLETTKQITDQIQQGAEAFQRMNLSTMLGQTGGGRGGELGDLVLGGMDLPEEQMNALRDAIDLATGRQTDMSQLVRDDIAPILRQIAEDEGPQAVAEAIMALNEALDRRTLAGDSPADMDTWMSGVLGGGGLGRSSGRGEGEGAGMSSEDFIASLGEGAAGMTTMAESSLTVSKSMTEALPGVEGIQSALPDITSGFSDMAGKSELFASHITVAHDLISHLVSSVQVIRVDFRPTAPAWMIAALNGTQAGAAFVTQVIQNAGGIGTISPDR